MENLVSIIIPVYNVEKYLNKCIESVVSQTYKNLDIIIIDDGSKDSSGKMCDEWASKDKRIRVIHKTNGGLSDARNVGIEHAKGNYISFVDSDDFIENDMIEVLLKEIKENNCDISICGYYKTYVDKDEIIDNSKEIFVMNKIEAIDRMNILGSYDVSAWGKLFNISLIKDIRFPVGKLSEDWFVMYKIFYNANRICYNPNPKYHYVQRAGGISKNNPKINYDAIQAAKECMEFIEEKCPNIIENATIMYCIANMGVYNSCILYNKEDKEVYSNIKKHLKTLLNSKNISIKKKIQFWILVRTKIIYRLIYKVYYSNIRQKKMAKQ